MRIGNYLRRSIDMWSNRILLYGILVFLGLMLIVAFIFYIHYLHTPGEDVKPWNSDGGMLLFTIFSAIFAGLNVLAFIELTVTIERQKDNSSLYHDEHSYHEYRNIHH